MKSVCVCQPPQPNLRLCINICSRDINNKSYVHSSDALVSHQCLSFVQVSLSSKNTPFQTNDCKNKVLNTDKCLLIGKCFFANCTSTLPFPPHPLSSCSSLLLPSPSHPLSCSSSHPASLSSSPPLFLLLFPSSSPFFLCLPLSFSHPLLLLLSPPGGVFSLMEQPSVCQEMVKDFLMDLPLMSSPVVLLCMNKELQMHCHRMLQRRPHRSQRSRDLGSGSAELHKNLTTEETLVTTT